jgi:ribosomal protein S18 acetylase RimI-like enzyme
MIVIKEFSAIKKLDPTRLLNNTVIASEVYNRQAGRDAALRFRLLAYADIADVRALHCAALHGLIDPVVLRPDSEQFFCDHIANKGFTIGAFADNKLIAYGILALPAGGGANFGRDIGLPGDELPAVAHIDGITVDPAWRGSGLQRLLALMRLELARAFGRSHALATVAPRNYYSWRNLTAVGFRIKALKVKYNLGWRFILHRRLGTPCEETRPPFRYMDVDDSAGQADLLDRGYWGYACFETAGGVRVAFGRAAADVGGAG